MKKCCINCFMDSYIKSYIKENGEIGTCSYCGATEVLSVDVDLAFDISEKLTRLIQIYYPSDDRKAKPLSTLLREDWDIFAVEEETILELTRDLCGELISIDSDIYLKNVSFTLANDEEFVKEYGITKDCSWHEFSEYLKYTNRFHSGILNIDAFASFLSSIVRVFSAGDVFYRARICGVGVDGYQIKEMGMPPQGERHAGRINPEGIGVLYLSLEDKTVLYEVRASKYDRITIGTFNANTELRIIDLSGIEALSPFSFDDDDMVERFAINKGIIKEIALEIARPMRRNDSVLDYLPTQFIAEFVKFQGYDGVAYKSTIYECGNNVALFDESKVTCVGVETKEVVDIIYKSDTV